MARLLTTGWEVQSALSGPLGNWPDLGTSSGAVSVDTTNHRSGASCLAFAGSATAAYRSSGVPGNTASGVTYYWRTYFRKTGNPAALSAIMAFLNGSSVVVYQVKLTTAGEVGLYAGTTLIGSVSSALADNTYYQIELSWMVNTTASAADAAELRLNGNTIATDSGVDRSSAIVATFRIGWVEPPGAGGPTLYADDTGYNDNTGTDQNSWPGDEKVVLLTATGMSATGSGWQKPGGATTNLNTAVDNTPPVGGADSTSAADAEKFIRNATAAANSDVDFTMTTYTGAGVGAGDTITTVTPFVATGAPVSTSAKLGDLQIVSNPAGTLTAFAVQGTSGAFWSSLAIGAWQTGWKGTIAPVIYNPSVTLGTAPVFRVRQETSSTRIADVVFVGVYVSYTPAAGGGATSLPLRRRQDPARFSQLRR